MPRTAENAQKNTPPAPSPASRSKTRPDTRPESANTRAMPRKGRKLEDVPGLREAFERIQAELRADDQIHRERRISRLGELTDDELIKLANGEHARYVGAHRKAIANHALIAGSALNELKKRAGHGNWERWLDENFKGGKVTANRYMKVAKNWNRIVDKGVTTASLTKMLQAISDSAPALEVNNDKRADSARKKPPKPPKARTIELSGDLEEYDDQVGFLIECGYGTGAGEVIPKAIALAYQFELEKQSGPNDSLDETPEQ